MDVKAWISSTRPPTLVASFIPLLVCGAYLASTLKNNARVSRITSLAEFPSSFFIYGGLLLIACISMQIACNFTNDYYDYLRGTDDESRRGPKRMLQQNIITPRAMKYATIVVYLIPLLIGIYFSYLLYIFHPTKGLVVLGFSVLSIIASFTYTGGKYPLGYHGLGDLAAFLFFGVGLTTMMIFMWGQSLQPNFINFNKDLPSHLWSGLIIGLPMGFFSLALININNLRDLDEDRKKNKNTLAVYLANWWGRKKVEQIFCGYLFLALLTPLTYPAYLLSLSIMDFTNHQTISNSPNSPNSNSLENLEWRIALMACYIFFILFLIRPAKIIFATVRANQAKQMNLALKATGKLYLISGLIQATFIYLF